MREEILLCLCLRALWYLQAQMLMHHHWWRCGRLLPPILRLYLDFLSDSQQSLISVMINDICLDGTLRTSELVEVCESIIICQLICYDFILNSQFYWVFYI